MKEIIKTKSGFAVMVGRSNVGKSTLLNSLVGTKIAIVTPKPLTTRHIIRGIVHDPRGQIVFVDTPGVVQKAKDILTAHINRQIKIALKSIDIILYVVDPTRAIGPEERHIFHLVTVQKPPKILVINKLDLPQKQRPYTRDYREWGKYFDAVVEVSALKYKNLKLLIDVVFNHLPFAKPFYPEFQLTDMENKFWIQELIREKVFKETHEEIPYTTRVEVDEIDSRNNLLYIKARILTTLPKYKKMIIGARALKIKQIGTSARRELEVVLGKKVFLDLEVAVSEKPTRQF